MSNLQPFLTGYSSKIYGSAKRKWLDVFLKRRAALIASSLREYALQFEPLLPAELLHRLSSSKRERHFGNVTTFWAWVSQIIDENASCSKAVSMVQAWCTEAHLPVPSSDTGGYCMARKRLATTLSDLKHTGQELAALYEQRWDIEVKIRDIKTTLGMEDFAVRTPDMATKTLAMLMIAYNLIKAVSQQAAIENGQSIAMMGFKGVLDIIVSYRSNYRGHKHHAFKRKALHRSLIEIISTKLLDKRPGRQEPRAIKKRPKPFPLLTAPRAQYVEILHRSSYRAAA